MKELERTAKRNPATGLMTPVFSDVVSVITESQKHGLEMLKRILNKRLREKQKAAQTETL